MIFEFKNMEDTIINNFYGGRDHISAKMHVDDNLKLMKGTLPPKASIGIHTHENNSEVNPVVFTIAQWDIVTAWKIRKTKTLLCTL